MMRGLRPRLSGVILLLLGSTILLWVGISRERTSPVSMIDFKTVYVGSRCLIEHRDPYKPDEMEKTYYSEGAGRKTDNPSIRFSVTRFIYLPTIFVITAPIALLPLGAAHIVWMILTAATFILAAFLTWDLAYSHAPIASACLICLFLITSELLIEVGNAAGIAVSLCTIAVWTFLRQKFVPAGILCMALSLLAKPHDAALIWLYFLIAGALHRKRAVITLLLAAGLALPAFIWISTAAPGWMHEMNLNLAQHSHPGADSDPGPQGVVAWAHGAQLINFQTVLSLVYDDPGFYNPVTYAVSGALLLVWLFAVLRSRLTPASCSFALAAAAAISMLPTYHRQQDTRILLLIIPAFALLWENSGSPNGKRRRWLALLFTSAAVLFTGDLTLERLGAIGYRFGATAPLHPISPRFSAHLATLLFARPAPLAILMVAIFYLWISCRLPKLNVSNEAHGDSHTPRFRTLLEDGAAE
jgi:hypothetical protein